MNDTFELGCLRRLLGILWTARRMNKPVKDEIKSAIPLDSLIKKRHILVCHILVMSCEEEIVWKKSSMLGMGDRL